MAFLEISSVTKSFGAVNVLQDVNLKIEHGEFIGHAGKPTFRPQCRWRRFLEI